MKIWIAQINTKVANTRSWLDYNLKKITDTITNIGKDCDIIVFPEMTMTGYPLNDILDDDVFVIQQKEGLKTIQECIQNTNTALQVIVGGVDFDTERKLPDGKISKYNTAYLLDGKSIQTYYKKLLPDYDVFFEKRYFQPGEEELYFKTTDNKDATITICEDFWDQHYDTHPVNDIATSWRHIDTVFNLSSSPFVTGKLAKRLDLLKRHRSKLPANYVYVNQVGGQDELVFDGYSMVMDKEEKLIYLADGYTEDIRIIDMDADHEDLSEKLVAISNEKYGRIYDTLTLGLSDYLAKTGIKDVVIWVSGWVDSAVDIALLHQFLAPEHIHALYLPTEYNSNDSYKLSKELCDNLGVLLDVFPIQAFVDTFEQQSTQREDKLEWLRHENLQARIRWLILMDQAAKYNSVVINNSNQTEMAMWYATMYGDSIGFMSPIGDLNKKEVYELAARINENKGGIIPQQIITRAPSAELKEAQIDPFDYVAESEAIEDLLYNINPITVQKKYPHLTLERVMEFFTMKSRNEWKRRQYPLIIKLKERSLSIGRQVPIVQG
jgi:NAD+ synthase (glutamine-hydrolysing)